MKLISESIIEFIYSFLNPVTVSLQQFIKFFYDDHVNFSEIFAFLMKHIKKKDRFLMILSYIYHEKTNKNYTKPFANAYSFISGYQMLAILFKSKSLGQSCNLVGNLKKDIYMEVNLAFNNLINTKIIPLTLDFERLLDIRDFNYEIILPEVSDHITEEKLLIHLLTINFKQYVMNTVLDWVDCLRRSTIANHINLIDTLDYSWFYLKHNLSEEYIEIIIFKGVLPFYEYFKNQSLDTRT